MSTQQLIARIQRRRESTLELEPGKTVNVRRPAELEMSDMRRGVTLDHIAKHVVGWGGVTEATLLGADEGTADEVEFHPDLWREVVADRGVWFNKVAAKLLQLMTEHIKSKAEAAKN